VEQSTDFQRPATSAERQEISAAERMIARERVLLDRQIELYRLRYLSAPVRRPGASPRPRHDSNVRPAD
jgi:hypothetical protein